MSVCVETVNKYPLNDFVSPVFIFERLCSIIFPVRHILLVIRAHCPTGRCGLGRPSYHWDIMAKLAVVIYKLLSGVSLQCLADDCHLTTTTYHRQLQLSNITMCEVPSLGNRSFTVAGPHLWNILPLHLCASDLTLLEFCWLLEMHLVCWGLRRLVTLVFRAPYKSTLTHYIT